MGLVAALHDVDYLISARPAEIKMNIIQIQIIPC